MAIEEAQLIRETAAATRTPAAGPRAGYPARRSRGADGRAHAPQRRSGARSRPTGPSSALAVDKLRGEITRSTDWRSQFRKHKREVLIGAAVAGFVLGGGIAALTGLLTRPLAAKRSAAARLAADRHHAARRPRAVGGGPDGLGPDAFAIAPGTRAIAIWSVAASGIASSAPSTPNSVAPNSTDRSTMNGCTLTARDWIAAG